MSCFAVLPALCYSAELLEMKYVGRKARLKRLRAWSLCFMLLDKLDNLLKG
ncbi:MAG: hypothetical protein ACLR56_14425 [Oscillospiraceae bacterium]